MRLPFLLLGFLAASFPSFAQMAQLPETATNPAAQAVGQVVGEARVAAANEENSLPDEAPAYEDMKFAVLQTLDKLTARTHTVILPVGKPSAVGPIFVDVKTCQKTLPTEQPEAAAFLQVWEAKPKSKNKDAVRTDNVQSQWVFSGWMFASSPALSAMNHPVYDVWVKDCTNDTASAKVK